MASNPPLGNFPELIQASQKLNLLELKLLRFIRRPEQERISNEEKFDVIMAERLGRAHGQSDLLRLSGPMTIEEIESRFELLSKMADKGELF